jgi:hypothetical protein
LLSDHYSIPKEIKSRHDTLSSAVKYCRGGVFPFSKVAYITLNGILYLWLYNTSGEIAMYEFDQCIVAVEHLKNSSAIKPEINTIGYFAVSTLTSVVICSLIKCDNCLRIMLTDFKMDVSTEVGCLHCSSNGRLFCGDSLGIVWEMDIKVKASLFSGKRIKKVESLSWSDILIPNLFKSTKSVKQIAVDETRHILYSLIESHTQSKDSNEAYISIYNLGLFGTSFSYLFSITPEQIFTKEFTKKQLKYTPKLNEWIIQAIAPIERTESDILNLMIYFSNGVRFYITFGRTNQKYEKEKNGIAVDWNSIYSYKPNGTFNVAYIIYPPSNISKIKRLNVSNSNVQIPFNESNNIENRGIVYTEKSMRSIFMLHSIDEKDNEMIGLSVDDVAIAKTKSFSNYSEPRVCCEVISKLNFIIHGSVLDIQEIDFCSTNGEDIANLLGFPTYKSTLQRKKNYIGGPSGKISCCCTYDINCSLYSAPKWFTVMTSNNIAELVKPRLVDNIFEMVVNDKYRELCMAIEYISPVEVCTCLLHIVCADEEERFYIKKIAGNNIRNLDCMKASYTYV